jgi:hypothetical protein
VIVKQETKQNKIKQKRNETQHNRNETKPKKSLINKKTKNINETIFFYMRQQFTKCQWRIEKPLKFMGRFGYGRKK